MAEALVIGAGPAGLMAAEMLGRAGHAVTLAEAMPTAGRKFLMAGKSGLNLTKDEAPDRFAAAYGPGPAALERALAGFGPAEMMEFARALGQPVFTGSSGRVFPVAMKASPFLRAWMARLADLGVTLRTRWRWEGFAPGGAVFATPEGPRAIEAGAIVLALGGASWARLGSDGAWAARFPGQVAPFQPANMGLLVDWSLAMAPRFGQPIKGAAFCAGGQRLRAEAVVSARGLEGGAIYALSRALREGAPLTLDLTPDLSAEEVARRLSAPRGKATLSATLRRRLHLDPVRLSLLHEFARPLPAEPSGVIKALPVRHAGPRPLDEAISTAGGLRFDALDGFMLRDRPGVFAAGEMLDWEAPTGGYLLTACFATGRAAGLQAADWLART